jgi:hypothetical protein
MRVLVHTFCVLSAAASVSAAEKPCDRACLKGVLDQYLSAVIKHDPSVAPLFVGFRQTENGIVVRPGEGVWKTVTALGKVQRRFMDAVNGQAGYFGLVEENGSQAIATLRLKVEDRKASEAEWVIARKDAWGPTAPGGNLFNADSLAANPPPERTVARDARSSRAAMVAIANSYFDGLTTHDGSVIIHEPGCSRIENGTTVTGRGRGAGRGATADGRGAVAAPGGTAGGDCSSNLENFNVMFYPPPDAPVPNWPPYEGNWPLPANFFPDSGEATRAPSAPAQNR